MRPERQRRIEKYRNPFSGLQVVTDVQEYLAQHTEARVFPPEDATTTIAETHLLQTLAQEQELEPVQLPSDAQQSSLEIQEAKHSQCSAALTEIAQSCNATLIGPLQSIEVIPGSVVTGIQLQKNSDGAVDTITAFIVLQQSNVYSLQSFCNYILKNAVPDKTAYTVDQLKRRMSNKLQMVIILDLPLGDLAFKKIITNIEWMFDKARRKKLQKTHKQAKKVYIETAPNPMLRTLHITVSNALNALKTNLHISNYSEISYALHWGIPVLVTKLTVKGTTITLVFFYGSKIRSTTKLHAELVAQNRITGTLSEFYTNLAEQNMLHFFCHSTTTATSLASLIKNRTEHNQNTPSIAQKSLGRKPLE